MTGEVSLRGHVLPVGGVREKVIAAHRAGIRRVLLPAANEKDLHDVTATALEQLQFVFVRHVDDLLEQVPPGEYGAFGGRVASGGLV